MDSGASGADLALALAAVAFREPPAGDPLSRERSYLAGAAVRVALKLRLEHDPGLESVLARYMQLLTRPNGVPGFDGRTFRIQATGYSEVHSTAGLDGVAGVFTTYAALSKGPEGDEAREAAKAVWLAAREAADELLDTRR